MGIPAQTRDHRIVQRLAVVLGSIVVGVVIGLGCSHAGVFRCESSEQCQDGEREGVCTDAGYCAFDDESCASGLEYGALAGSELAGTCVPVGGGTGSSGEPSSDVTTSSSSSSDGPPVTSDETGPPPVCLVGEACKPDDPCALDGVCGADGTCVPTEVVPCDAPPGPCYTPRGVCQPERGCVYPPLRAMSACDDGDSCTLGDGCDGMGTCVPGPLCPSNDPCQPQVCTEEGCVPIDAEDGISCGPLAEERCCDGECVDISSDPQHCGGCDAGCAPGQPCESVEVTSECLDSPPDTSGRCRCVMADAECPEGQLCRTVAPYAGRCAPADERACDGEIVEVDLCPNYCSY